jgi:hypothetical protein
MTTETNQDLREWIADWQDESTASSHSTPAEEIRRHVRRRERLLVWWLAGDFVVGVAFFTFLLHRAVTHPDPIEKLAMGLLTLAVAAIAAFEVYNWRGTLGASAETTSAHLSLALDRSRRLQKGLRAGWPLLASEVAVLAPWIWYQLHGNGAAATIEQSLFGWGLLTTLTGAGGLALILLQRRARRDAATLESLRRELMGDDITT